MFFLCLKHILKGFIVTVEDSEDGFTQAIEERGFWLLKSDPLNGKIESNIKVKSKAKVKSEAKSKVKVEVKTKVK